MKLSAEQFELFGKQFTRLKNFEGGFYQNKYKGIDAVKTQADFESLPFTNKEELRDAYPLGIPLTVPEEEIVRIHSSSGTTGTPSSFLTQGRMWRTGQ